MFNLKTGKQRHIVAIPFHAMHHIGHDMAHELLSLFVNIVGINQDFADIGLEVIADCADHERGFLVNQERAGSRFVGAFNGTPELHQIIQIPLQFVNIATNTCGTGNDGHAGRQIQLVHRIAQFLAIFTFNPTGYTATAWIVWH